MNAERIIEALSHDAAYTFEFDVTTGQIEHDIIGSDGTDYTKKAGLSAPCSFNDLIRYYFGPEVHCRILAGSHIQSISSEYLLESYFSGKIRNEINLFFPMTNSYYRTLYFLYEDETSGHIMAYVISRVITEVENEIFTANGDRKSQLQKEKENFYKNMMDTQSCGVFAYSYPGYQIVTANAEALRMFGCESIDQIQDNSIEIFSHVYYPSAETVENLKKLRTEDAAVDYECFFNKGKENECYVIAKTKIIYSPNGRRIIYSTYVDASEMHALQVALEKAEEGNRAKSTFLFNISHDLRTPMNAIIGYAELMESHWDDEDATKKYLKKLMDSSNFLMFLLNNAIELASFENGVEKLKESVWNATRFNDMLDAIIEGLVQEKNLHFSRKIEIEHNNIMCDATKLRIIFLNLLSNAIKYTPSGGSVSMKLEERPSDREGYALFRTVVSDTGIGISPDFLPHIYENFSREKNTSLSGIHGTGLGMPLVKRMVDLMGGSISVESSPGNGTTVTVTIPHKLVSIEEMVTVSEGKMNTESKVVEGKKILLVEDNDFNAEIAEMILSDAGFLCERVVDGATAVEAVEKHAADYYDLVLMDIQMPVMDGYQATYMIRKMEGKKSRIPIVAMTANSLEEDKRAALAAGMNDHIAKPIDISKLLDTLFRILK